MGFIVLSSRFLGILEDLPGRLTFEQPKGYVGAYPGVDAYHTSSQNGYLGTYLGDYGSNKIFARRMHGKIIVFVQSMCLAHCSQQQTWQTLLVPLSLVTVNL